MEVRLGYNRTLGVVWDRFFVLFFDGLRHRGTVKVEAGHSSKRTQEKKDELAQLQAEYVP